jgi:hypothetical protein
MKPISDFFPRVLPYLPGCPEPMAEQALLDSAIAFCEDSSAVRVSLVPVAVTVDVSTYSLDAPSQQVIARVMGVQFDGRPLYPVSAEDVELLTGATGNPVAYYTRQGTTSLELVLFPTPDVTGSLDISVATLPARTATQLPDELFVYWSDAVTAGAISRAKAIPNQPFTDPAGAAGYAAAALAASRKARIEGNFGRAQSHMRVRSRPFA